MRFESENELEGLLYGNWWETREAGLFDGALPDLRSDIPWCGRIIRQFALPGAAKGGGTGYVDLLEVVVKRPPQGRPIVFVSPIELKNETATVGHLAQAHRYTSCLDAHLGGRDVDFPIYSVQGLLLVPGVNVRLSLLLESSAPLPWRESVEVRTFTIDPLRGLRLVEPARSDPAVTDDSIQDLVDRMFHGWSTGTEMSDSARSPVQAEGETQ